MVKTNYPIWMTRFFKNFTKMSGQDFAILLEMISSIIAKQNTFFREVMLPEDKCKISRQIILRSVPEVCRATCELLRKCIKVCSVTTIFYLQVKLLK